MNDQARTVAIHLSLIRPILLLGAERELVLLSGVVAAILVMSLQRVVFTVIGVVVWITSVALLQRAAKADPQLSRVYLRQTRYRGYYPAQSRPTAPGACVRESMPC